jgi:hypothetical protein
MGDPNSIEVKRRRQSGSSGPQGRADAPVRRDGGGGGQGGPPPSRPSGGGGQFSGLPGGKKLPAGAVILLFIVIVLISLFSNNSDSQPVDYPTSDFDNAATLQPQVKNTAAEAAKQSAATSTRSVSASGQTWLVMLYQDADDQILEQDIYIDLNEAERVGSSENVQIVAQIDRYRSAFSGDGNWTSARRYFIERDEDLARVGSPMVADLGEVNMGEGQTLVDFVTWAAQTYPADRYVLILSDHGMGWPGGWSDPAPALRDSGSAPITSALDSNYLYLNELDQALGKIRAETGIERFEMIGMDACLMAHLEVMEAMRPHARYLVASQETEPALGWAYAGFLQALESDPGMSGAELSRRIVTSYISDDERIVDDSARADLLRQGSPMGGLFGGVPSASAVARQMEQGVTLSAVDLDRIPALTASLNQLALALQNADQRLVARARTYARSYTSVWGRDVPNSYLDLANFVQLLRQESGEGPVADAAAAVVKDVRAAVVAEKHGPEKNGSNGISIYFPNSQLYQNPVAGARSYTVVADRFAQGSLWDDFLAFHYTNRSFEPDSNQSVIPPAGGPSRAPGAGSIAISGIQISAAEAAPGQPVLVSASVDGQNIGYIYLFVGYFDSTSNSIYVADSDYLESPGTREVEGVFYPQWDEEKPFTLNLDWEPTVFSISDGTNTVGAVFNPLTYGESAQDTVYTVDGLYTPADGGERRYSRLYFRDGELRQVFGFTTQEATGSPREIIPQSGDTFTVLEKWYDLDSSGNVAQTSAQEGGTLTFGSDTFRWQEQYAAPGQYLIGFLVADLEGSVYPAYQQVTVR